jgi:uncharacterized protein YcbK (DUF882 family)
MDSSGHYPEVYETFFRYFQQFREALGKPIKIGSGYRCPKHNQAIGGELGSVHTYGLAMDMECPDDSGVDELVSIVTAIHPEVRMGIYKQAGKWVHFDVGYMLFPKLFNEWTEGARWQG